MIHFSFPFNKLSYVFNIKAKNEDYYVTRIGSIPDINESSYRLNVTGLVKNPKSFKLSELRALDMVELPLTVECIGNSPKGPLISTAIWKGFRLYDLLSSLGLNANATGVSYKAADGYYASHTMDQIKNNGIIDCCGNIARHILDLKIN